MDNRWVCRFAFVGLTILSVAVVTGCRSTSHGRSDDGCRGCNDRRQVQTETTSAMPPMHKSAHNRVNIQ